MHNDMHQSLLRHLSTTKTFDSAIEERFWVFKVCGNSKEQLVYLGEQDGFLLAHIMPGKVCKTCYACSSDITIWSAVWLNMSGFNCA